MNRLVWLAILIVLLPHTAHAQRRTPTPTPLPTGEYVGGGSYNAGVLALTDWMYDAGSLTGEVENRSTMDLWYPLARVEWMDYQTTAYVDHPVLHPGERGQFTVAAPSQSERPWGANVVMFAFVGEAPDGYPTAVPTGTPRTVTMPTTAVPTETPTMMPTEAPTVVPTWTPPAMRHYAGLPYLMRY